MLISGGVGITPTLPMLDAALPAASVALVSGVMEMTSLFIFTPVM